MTNTALREENSTQTVTFFYKDQDTAVIEQTAAFDLDLPFGKYYIRELAAPAGYVSSDETLDVTAAYQGQDVKVVKLASEFKNQPTKITVKKSDITTGVELSGATLTVLDKDKNVIDTDRSGT